MTYIQQATDPTVGNLAGRRLGRYEVLARLASGGMAGVYVARAVGVAGFERLFAIKVLHPHLAHEEEFISMFLDEARLAARIRHPNVVATIDISDTQDAGFYLVMDYVEGDHLGALLRRASELRTRLPTPVALRIVVDALNGLAAAHGLVDEHNRRLNLVHRDISPHNIMVGVDGVARLTDFGVAKAERRISATRDGQFKGKLAYMAPEHASEGVADQRSDLFAMGIILWEALTGQRLFRGENQAATLSKVCLGPIPDASTVDPALKPIDPILLQALCRDRRKRFQTAEEFAEAVERTANTLGGLANQRMVAKIVRTFAAAKIARDDHLIRTAASELTPSRRAPGPSESGERMRFTWTPTAPSLTNPTAPSPAPSMPNAQNLLPAVRRSRMYILAVASLTLGLGLLVYLLTSSQATVSEPRPSRVLSISAVPSGRQQVQPREPSLNRTESASTLPAVQAVQTAESGIRHSAEPVHSTPDGVPAQSAETRDPSPPPSRSSNPKLTTQRLLPRGPRSVKATAPPPASRPLVDPAPTQTEPAARGDDLLLNPYR